MRPLSLAATRPLLSPRALRALAALIAAAAAAICAASFSPAASAAPVWLCKPGLHPAYCSPSLATTVFTAKLARLFVQHPKRVRNPGIDCFYVYPTVSDEKTGNSDLVIHPEERSIALYQAARYSQYCNLYAPMYRQVTLGGIGTGGSPTTKPSPALAYQSARSAFLYYLRHFNHGRGFVLIGHSQGSFVLRQLISHEVDPKPAVRSRLISAILLGGNVLVKPGPKGIGGDFKHLPACHTATQLHCVIAFSTFDQPVPSGSLFGKPSPILGSPVPKGTIVLCVNPAALLHSTLLHPVFPSAPFAPGTLISIGIQILNLRQPHPATTWFTLSRAYTGRCVTSNGAHVLMVKAINGAQTANPSPDKTWGLHLLDANIALGDLVQVVKDEAVAYLQQHP